MLHQPSYHKINAKNKWFCPQIILPKTTSLIIIMIYTVQHSVPTGKMLAVFYQIILFEIILKFDYQVYQSVSVIAIKS